MSKRTFPSHLLLFISILAGCSTTGVLPPEQKRSAIEQEQIAQCKKNVPDQDRVQKEAVTTGCITTMVAWRAIGQNNPAALICMVGGGTGFLLGESIAERKCAYLTEEERLNGEIAHASSMNSKFAIYSLQSKKDLALYEKQIKTLAAQRQAEAANSAEQEKLKQSLAKQLAKERQTIKQVQDEQRFKQATLQEARQKAKQASVEKADKLEAEIRILQKNIRQMQEAASKLQDYSDLL